MKDFRLYSSDLRYLQTNAKGEFMCTNGIKAWAQSHGICLRKFVIEGIMASELLATGDEWVEALVRKVQEERRNGRE